MVIRVSGVVIPSNKHVKVALRSIFGIGNTKALEICNRLNIDSSKKMYELSDSIIISMQKLINEYEVEGILRKKISLNIKRLCDIKSYVGLRHKMGLPTRGQRTKTNAKTRKKRRVR